MSNAPTVDGGGCRCGHSKRLCYNIFAAGRQNKVAVMVGSNGDEGASLGAAGPQGVTLAEYRKTARATGGDEALEFGDAVPVRNGIRKESA